MLKENPSSRNFFTTGTRVTRDLNEPCHSKERKRRGICCLSAPGASRPSKKFRPSTFLPSLCLCALVNALGAQKEKASTNGRLTKRNKTLRPRACFVLHDHGSARHMRRHADARPVPNADRRTHHPFCCRPQQLPQRLHTVKQSFTRIRGHDQMLLVGEQQIPFRAYGLVRVQPVLGQESSYSRIGQPRQHDRLALDLSLRLH